MKKASAMTLPKQKRYINSAAAIGLGATGFGLGQIALSKVNKPLVEAAGVVGGILLVANPKSHNLVKAAATGLAIVSGIRLINRFSTPKNGAAPNAIQSFVGKFIPNLQGLGQLGELGYALAASPTVSYDNTTGNVVELNGFDGDEDLNGDEDMMAGFEGTEDNLLGIEETANSLL